MAIPVPMRVGTSTTTGQIDSTSNEHVRMIEWHARADNTGTIVIGMSDVSASVGRELSPDERVTWNYSELGEDSTPGYFNFNEAYAHFNVGGDLLDWTIFLARD